MNKYLQLHVAVTLVLGLMMADPGYAEDEIYKLRLKDHHFDPVSIEIPAHKKVKLLIQNMDSTAEEFESDDLHREKVIPPGSEGAVFIGPLDPGTYKFTGEYHAATASGAVFVK